MDKSEKSYHQLKTEFPTESEQIDLNEATQFLESLRWDSYQQIYIIEVSLCPSVPVVIEYFVPIKAKFLSL